VWISEFGFIRYTGTGEAEHRKRKRLTLGGGQAYDCSGVQTTFVTLVREMRPNVLYKP